MQQKCVTQMMHNRNDEIARKMEVRNVKGALVLFIFEFTGPSLKDTSPREGRPQARATMQKLRSKRSHVLPFLRTTD